MCRRRAAVGDVCGGLLRRRRGMFEPRARVRRERRATALAKEVVVVLDDDAGKTTTTEKRRRWTRRGGLRGGRVRGRA